MAVKRVNQPLSPHDDFVSESEIYHRTEPLSPLGEGGTSCELAFFVKYTNDLFGLLIKS